MLHQRGREVKIALLSMYRFEEVRGGTEIFIEHLRKAFPDLQVITYSSVERKRDLDLSRLSLEEAKKDLPSVVDSWASPRGAIRPGHCQLNRRMVPQHGQARYTHGQHLPLHAQGAGQ